MLASQGPAADSIVFEYHGCVVTARASATIWCARMWRLSNHEFVEDGCVTGGMEVVSAFDSNGSLIHEDRVLRMSSLFSGTWTLAWQVISWSLTHSSQLLPLSRRRGQQGGHAAGWRWVCCRRQDGAGHGICSDQLAEERSRLLHIRTPPPALCPRHKSQGVDTVTDLLQLDIQRGTVRGRDRSANIMHS